MHFVFYIGWVMEVAIYAGYGKHKKMKAATAKLRMKMMYSIN